MKLRLHLPPGGGRWSSLVVTFHRDGARVLEKDIPGFKNGKRLEEGLNVRMKEKFYDYRISKLNAIKKVGQGHIV